jgi:hypothetical protein
MPKDEADSRYKGIGKDNDITIEQFTGLLDKNGKEIYEGDIVLDCDEDINMDVIFENGIFCTCNTNSIYEMDDIEVIGNIHENPELLNK